MEEIKLRTLVVRIFPNATACLRLVVPWPLRSMRTGSRPSNTSTWNRWPNRKRKLADTSAMRPKPQPAKKAGLPNPFCRLDKHNSFPSESNAL